MNTTLSLAEMERARLGRDAAYDGLFVFAVRTTGVFCRPTCGARTPLTENVEYFTTARGAVVAGYRPCKRCRPLPEDQQPTWVADLITSLLQDPSVRISEAALKARGIDPTTARRFFLRNYGMTFHAFARAHRLGRALNHLQAGGSLDTAVFESGYESHSGFREAFGRLFEGTPGQSKSQRSVLLTWLPTPLGPMLAGATAQGICLLEFADRQQLAGQFQSLSKTLGATLVPGSNDHLELLQTELAGYFSGETRQFRVPLDYRGTPFQRRVWEQLLTIPYGETWSYEALATKIGSPTAVRAVGRANATNRIAIVIPCHRVVSKSGELTGYAGGLRRKQYLLRLEQTGEPERPVKPTSTGRTTRQRELFGQ